MKKNANQTASKVIQIPHRLRHEHESFYSLLKSTGYFENYRDVSESDIAEELSRHSEAVLKWIELSEDSRTGGGWYLKRAKDPGTVILGHYAPGAFETQETLFKSPIETCAKFIKLEIEKVRNTVPFFESPPTPAGFYPPSPTFEEMEMQEVDVPLLGETVAAGRTFFGEENTLQIRQVSRDLATEPHRYFCLAVCEDALDVVGIADGDLVLVRQQSGADDGQPVVALVDGKALLREYSQAEGKIVLQPRSTNPVYRPIVLADNSLIQGVVTKVWRGLSKPSGFEDIILGYTDQVKSGPLGPT